MCHMLFAYVLEGYLGLFGFHIQGILTNTGSPKVINPATIISIHEYLNHIDKLFESVLEPADKKRLSNSLCEKRKDCLSFLI
jgi:hypothetical protein